MPELTKRYRVVTLKLAPLYVASSMTFREQVDVFANFLSLMSDEPVAVMACSYGAAICWATMVKFPEKISKAVFIGPMPPFATRRIRSVPVKAFVGLGRYPKILALYLASPMAFWAMGYLEGIFQFPWMKFHDGRWTHITWRKARVVAAALHKFSWIMQSEDWGFWESRLRFVAHPIVMLWGEKDSLFSDREVKKFSELFLNSTRHEIPNAGHVSMNENPEAILNLVAEFLETKEFSGEAVSI